LEQHLDAWAGELNLSRSVLFLSGYPGTGNELIDLMANRADNHNGENNGDEFTHETFPLTKWIKN